jgi:hypothetical protein
MQFIDLNLSLQWKLICYILSCNNKSCVETSHRAVLLLATKQSMALFSPGTLRPFPGPARHGPTLLLISAEHWATPSQLAVYKKQPSGAPGTGYSSPSLAPMNYICYLIFFSFQKNVEATNVYFQHLKILENSHNQYFNNIYVRLTCAMNCVITEVPLQTAQLWMNSHYR